MINAEVKAETRFCDGSILHKKKENRLSTHSRCRSAAFIAAIETILLESPYPPHVMVSERTQEYLALLAKANIIGGIDAINEIKILLQVTDKEVRTHRTKLVRQEWANVWWRLNLAWQAIWEK